MARLEREWTEVAERKKAAELKARLAELAEIDSVTNSDSLCEYLVRAAKHAALVRAVPGKTNTITRDFDSFDFAKLSFSRPRFAQPGGAVLEKLQREATADMTAAVAQDVAAADASQKCWEDDEIEDEGAASDEQGDLGVEEEADQKILLIRDSSEVSVSYEDGDVEGDENVEEVESEGEGEEKSGQEAKAKGEKEGEPRAIPIADNAEDVSWSAHALQLSATELAPNLASDLLDADLENELLEAESFVSSLASAILVRGGCQGPAAAKLSPTLNVTVANVEEALEVRALEEEHLRMRHEQTQALRVLSELIPEAAAADKHSEERLVKADHYKGRWGDWANSASWQVGSRYDPSALIAPAPITPSLRNDEGSKEAVEEAAVGEAVGEAEEGAVNAAETRVAAPITPSLRQDGGSKEAMEEEAVREAVREAVGEAVGEAEEGAVDAVESEVAAQVGSKVDENSPMDATPTSEYPMSKSAAERRRAGHASLLKPVRNEAVKQRACSTQTATMVDHAGSTIENDSTLPTGPTRGGRGKTVMARNAIGTPVLAREMAKRPKSSALTGENSNYAVSASGKAGNLRSLFLGGAATEGFSLLRGSEITSDKRPSQMARNFSFGVSLLGSSKAVATDASAADTPINPTSKRSGETTTAASVADSDGLGSAAFVGRIANKGHPITGAIAGAENFHGDSCEGNGFSHGSQLGTCSAGGVWAIRSQSFMRTKDEQTLRKTWRRQRTDVRQAYRKLHQDTLRQRRKNQHVA